MNISAHGSPTNIRRRKMLLTDIENLKKIEINRRRRLRLEQVTKCSFLTFLKGHNETK